MKVFINFGNIRCVVPVGDGSLTVKEMTDLAVERYQKATCKFSDSKITVHTLKTCRDGAILDPDDILTDVADDREQLIALFDGVDKANYYLQSTNPNTNGFDVGPKHASTHRYNPQPVTNGTSLVNSSTSAKLNGNRASYQPQSHSLSHYSQLNDGIYGRTAVHSSHLPSAPSNQTFNNLPYHQRHQRSDSVSDSLLSSNESPDVFQHDDDAYYGQLNGHNHSANYSCRVPCKNDNFKSSNSNGLSSSKCDNTSHRGDNNSLSRTYDTKHSCLNNMNRDSSDEVVEITADQINSYANCPMLLVRHGSEPTLSASNPNQTKPDLEHVNETNQTADGKHSDNQHSQFIASSNDLNDSTVKRWSTAIAVDHHSFSVKNPLNANYEQLDEDKSLNSISPQSAKEEGYASEERPNSQTEQPSTQLMSPPTTLTSPHSLTKFTRGSGRLSIIANNIDNWADAADRQLIRLRNNEAPSPGRDSSSEHCISVNPKKDDTSRHHKSHHHHHQIYDSSLGSMSSSSQENENLSSSNSFEQFKANNSKNDDVLDQITVIIDLAKESGPLGIHVLPDTNTGLNTILKQGLLIQGIEPGGRIDRDGRLHVGDTIVDVDNHRFAGLDFEKAQKIFRSSLQNSQIKLKIMKLSYCNSTIKQLINESTSKAAQLEDNNETENSYSFDYENDIKDNEILVEGEERAGQLAKVATVTSTRKHSTGSIIGYKPPSSAIAMANTRRIGKKYHIQLKKGSHGLGFTITTRDNPAGGLSPIYIKTILPQGASIQDGRLKPGDRLLEVCGIEMTGKSQEDAVKILRNLPMDSIVDIIVSRQEVEVSPSPLMPRQLPPEKVNEPNCSSLNEREVMTFQIPLNDTGSAGLGVSVKGKTSNVNGKQMDLGIFVKSVIHGGAASKDGQLRQDDQLININSISLSRKTNSEAMETLRRAMIKSEDSQITLTIARRVCRSPTHCTENNFNHSYRHQHEASILSSDSFDMSFGNASSSYSPDINITETTLSSPYEKSHNDSSCHEEDSYRSLDNTVIYNSSKCHSINCSDRHNTQDSNHPNGLSKSLNDSELSLNETDDPSERFKRDGFGRQSMSEKRHAQLDAKSTDTYRKNKKSKENDLEGFANEEINVHSETAKSMTSHQARFGPINSHSYGEDEQNADLDALHRIDSKSPKGTDVPASVACLNTTTPKSKSPTKTQMLFSPTCCWKCQSPGSCPYHSKSELESQGRSRNGLYLKNANLNLSDHSSHIKDTMVNSPFGLRKSCSLESLQMMMQDLQKEQLEKVGGNIPGFAGARHGTVRVARSRETNESFRVAVDRSYDIARTNMEHVDEEYADFHHDGSMSRPSICPYRVGGGHSMTSTNYTAGTTVTTTTTDEDNAHLLKSKKKKGIFKNLFHFGSKKGRSKSASCEPSDSRKMDDSRISEDWVQVPHYNQKYQIEQDKINLQYRKLLLQEQQKQKPQYNFVRNQLHPMHQSMPMSIAHRSKANQNVKTEPMISPPNGSAYHTYGYNPSNMMNRDTVGVPQLSKNEKMNALIRHNNRRIHPEFKMNESGSIGESNNKIRQSDGPHHLRINSQEIYNRKAIDSPGSRIAITDNSNYGTYGPFSNANSNHHSNNVPSNAVPNGSQFYTVSRLNNSSSSFDKNSHHYRQLSLRNPHHHRQISSPATSQQYQSSPQTRPVSSYYEQAPGSASQVGPPYHQLQPSYTNGKNETLYGIVGQQIVNKRPMTNAPQSNLIRQQQQIYQSNQVQIYGSVYNPQNATNPTNFIQGQNQGNRPSNMQYPNYVRNELIYGTRNGMPNPYSTKE